jgi:hypothetical protein
MIAPAGGRKEMAAVRKKDGKLRLGLEIIGAVLLAGSLLTNFWQVQTNTEQSETSKKQLQEARVANEQTKKSFEEARKAREEDKAQHAKERKEDKDEQVKLQNKFDEVIKKTEQVRTELLYATQGFILSFDGAVTNAEKSPLNTINFQQIKSLAEQIIAQRKLLRDTTRSVQANMTIIYNAVDSNIDALEREINAPAPNVERIKELIRLIGNSKGKIEDNVVQAREAALKELGCNQRAYAEALPHS